MERNVRVCHACGRSYQKNVAVCVERHCGILECDGNCPDADLRKAGTKYCAFCKADEDNSGVNNYNNRRRLSVNTDVDADPDYKPSSEYSAGDYDASNYDYEDSTNTASFTEESVTLQEYKVGLKPRINNSGSKIGTRAASTFDAVDRLYGKYQKKSPNDIMSRVQRPDVKHCSQKPGTLYHNDYYDFHERLFFSKEQAIAARSNEATTDAEPIFSDWEYSIGCFGRDIPVVTPGIRADLTHPISNAQPTHHCTLEELNRTKMPSLPRPELPKPGTRVKGANGWYECRGYVKKYDPTLPANAYRVVENWKVNKKGGSKYSSLESPKIEIDWDSVETIGNDLGLDWEPIDYDEVPKLVHTRIDRKREVTHFSFKAGVKITPTNLEGMKYSLVEWDTIQVPPWNKSFGISPNAVGYDPGFNGQTMRNPRYGKFFIPDVYTKANGGAVPGQVTSTIVLKPRGSGVHSYRDWLPFPVTVSHRYTLISQLAERLGYLTVHRDKLRTVVLTWKFEKNEGKRHWPATMLPSPQKVANHDSWSSTYLGIDILPSLFKYFAKRTRFVTYVTLRPSRKRLVMIPPFTYIGKGRKKVTVPKGGYSEVWSAVDQYKILLE